MPVRWLWRAQLYRRLVKRLKARLRSEKRQLDSLAPRAAFARERAAAAEPATVRAQRYRPEQGSQLVLDLGPVVLRQYRRPSGRRVSLGREGKGGARWWVSRARGAPVKVGRVKRFSLSGSPQKRVASCIRHLEKGL
jgi:hypothetical protein